MLEGKNNRWSVKDDNQIRELAANGKSAQQIAVRLRRSRASIRTRARALGVELRELQRLPYNERWSA
jgi:hypothetical protein